MSKRTLEETAAADAPVRKKSKNEKTKASYTDAPSPSRPDDGPSKSKKDGREKLGKKDKKDKKDKKRLREKAAKDINGSSDVANTSEGKEAEAAKAERKAARKAEKSRLKALKKGKRDDLGDSSSTATPATLMSAATSTAPSKETSCVTTPEPSLPTSPADQKYVEDSTLAALPQADIDAYLESHQIAISDPLSAAATYRPITSFSYLPITDEAQRAPFASFASPTPIQAAAWPPLLAGRDVVGVAETGSGKTLAFGVPCIQHIIRLPKKQRKGVKAVIVSPTRELACQIHEQLVSLAAPAGLRVACVYGGVSKDDQRNALKKASIVVATPGRLNDLINEGAADISDTSYMVLDEADRMLDKGFEEEIRRIINNTLPKGNRQTLMFTATWPPSIRDLASTFMASPVRISIGNNPTGELRANTRISQQVEVVSPKDKQYRLSQLLKEHQSGREKNAKILVFCLYKKEATRIENFIRSKGFRVAGIHGDLSQAQRTSSLEAFKQGNVPILVATDVAARGLDIPAVKLVINVTFPLTAEDYVHRIGRTGRAGQDGKAITLFTEEDKALSGALINVLRAANQPVPEALMKFGTTVKKKGHEAYGAFYRETDGIKKATKIVFD